MGPNPSGRRGLSAAVLLLGTLGLLPALQAAGNGSAPAAPASLRSRAERYQNNRQWDRAADLWEQLLARDRSSADVRGHYQYCLRRAQQVRRLHDGTYRAQINTLALQDALRIYDEVLSRLHQSYVDRTKVEFPLLFRNGLEELRLALDEAVFRQAFLPGVKPEAVQAFQARLQANWGNPAIHRSADAGAQAREVALAAQKELGLRPTAALLELAAGACSALDEHTYYLTPGQFAEQDASWKGQAVGVGIEVSVEDEKLIVSQVLPGSPAATEGVREHDRITRIGERPTAGLSAEAAAELLKGRPGTHLSLEVISPVLRVPMLMRLRRQMLHVPSVSGGRFLDDDLGIGYIQLRCFQETTPGELDQALGNLQALGMKALILDLRGNPGGLFEVAIQVAQRFVSSGVVVFTQGQEPEYNRIYQAHSPNVLTVPLVVLIDGDTASSAELLAGAVKENQRARLVGKTTYGKGSVQKVHRLASAACGIRMTVAKFFSPRGHPYSGNGVTPNIEAAALDGPADPDEDPQLEAALEVARPLALER